MHAPRRRSACHATLMGPWLGGVVHWRGFRPRTMGDSRVHAPYSLVSTKRRTCLSHSDLCPHTPQHLQYCSMYAGCHSVLLVLCRAVPQQPAREALRAEIIRPLADLGWTFRAIMMRDRCLRGQSGVCGPMGAVEDNHWQGERLQECGTLQLDGCHPLYRHPGREQEAD